MYLYTIIITILGFIFTIVVDLWMVVLFYLLNLTFSILIDVVRGAWMQDKYLEENIGKFQGVRLIFMVLLPMVIDPFIGSFIILYR